MDEEKEKLRLRLKVAAILRIDDNHFIWIHPSARRNGVQFTYIEFGIPTNHLEFKSYEDAINHIDCVFFVVEVV